MTAPFLASVNTILFSRCSSTNPSSATLSGSKVLWGLWPVTKRSSVWCCGFFTGRPRRNLVWVVLVEFVYFYQIHQGSSSVSPVLFCFIWSIVDLQHCVSLLCNLQCCVSFRCTAKWICYIHIHTPNLFGVLFPIGHYRVFSWYVFGRCKWGGGKGWESWYRLKTKVLNYIFDVDDILNIYLKAFLDAFMGSWKIH